MPSTPAVLQGASASSKKEYLEADELVRNDDEEVDIR
jgi:hypothetical protein